MANAYNVGFFNSLLMRLIFHEKLAFDNLLSVELNEFFSESLCF